MVSAVCFVSLIATGDAFAQEVSVFRESIAEIANSFFGWLADSVARPLFGMARTLFLASFKFTIIEFGGYWEGKGNLVGLGPIWTMFRDIVNVLIVLLFIISSVITVLGESTFSVNRSKTLIMLIAAAVFVNFSGFIAFLLIDLSHVLLVVFADQIFNPSALVQLDVFAEEMKIMLGLSGARGDELSLMFSMSRLVNYVFLMFSFIAFSLVLLERFLIAIFLILLSPIASLGLFVKQTGLGNIGLGSFFTKAFDAWWKKFSQIVFTPIVLLIGITVVMSIYQRVYESVLPAGGGNLDVSGIGDSSADSLGFLISILIANVILVYGFLKLYKIAKSEKWYTGAGLGARVTQRSANVAKGLLKTGLRGGWDSGVRRYNKYAEEKGWSKAGEGKFVSGAKHAGRGVRSLWKGQSWQIAQKDSETEKRRADLEKRAGEIIKNHGDDNKYPNFKMTEAEEKKVQAALNRLKNAKGSGGRSMQGVISGAAGTIEEQERKFKNMYGSGDDETDGDGQGGDGPDNDGPDNDGPDNGGPDNGGPDNGGPDNGGPDNGGPGGGGSGGGGSGGGGTGGGGGTAQPSTAEDQRKRFIKRGKVIYKKLGKDNEKGRGEVGGTIKNLKEVKGSDDAVINDAIGKAEPVFKKYENELQDIENERERLMKIGEDILGNMGGDNGEGRLDIKGIVEGLKGAQSLDAAAIQGMIDKAEPVFEKYENELREIEDIKNEGERLMKMGDGIFNKLGKDDEKGRGEVGGIIGKLGEARDSGADALKNAIDEAEPVLKRYQDEMDIKDQGKRFIERGEDILGYAREEDRGEVEGIVEGLKGAQSLDAAAIQGMIDKAEPVFEKYENELREIEDIKNEGERLMKMGDGIFNKLGKDDEKGRGEVGGIIGKLGEARDSGADALKNAIDEAEPVLKRYQDEMDIKDQGKRFIERGEDILGYAREEDRGEVEGIVEGLKGAQSLDAAAIQGMIDKAEPVFEKYENELRDIEDKRERLVERGKDILGYAKKGDRGEVEGMIKKLEEARGLDDAANKRAIDEAWLVLRKYEDEQKLYKALENGARRGMFSSIVNRFFRKSKE